jgi:hypothetical protein
MVKDVFEKGLSMWAGSCFGDVVDCVGMSHISMRMNIGRLSGEVLATIWPRTDAGAWRTLCLSWGRVSSRTQMGVACVAGFDPITIGARLGATCRLRKAAAVRRQLGCVGSAAVGRPFVERRVEPAGAWSLVVLVRVAGDALDASPAGGTASGLLRSPSSGGSRSRVVSG